MEQTGADSPAIGVAVWAVLVAGLLAYQGFCLLSPQDRWPAITDILRTAITNRAGRWLLFGGWLWLGWHMFVRTLRYPYVG
jgi:hypothetical protein